MNLSAQTRFHQLLDTNTSVPRSLIEDIREECGVQAAVTAEAWAAQRGLLTT